MKKVIMMVLSLAMMISINFLPMVETGTHHDEIISKPMEDPDPGH